MTERWSQIGVLVSSGVHAALIGAVLVWGGFSEPETELVPLVDATFVTEDEFAALSSSLDRLEDPEAPNNAQDPVFAEPELDPPAPEESAPDASPPDAAQTPLPADPPLTAETSAETPPTALDQLEDPEAAPPLEEPVFVEPEEPPAAEIQEPEIQEPEIQEPETRDPEGQELETAAGPPPYDGAPPTPAAPRFDPRAAQDESPGDEIKQQLDDVRVAEKPKAPEARQQDSPPIADLPDAPAEPPEPAEPAEAEPVAEVETPAPEPQPEAPRFTAAPASAPVPKLRPRSRRAAPSAAAGADLLGDPGELSLPPGLPPRRSANRAPGPAPKLSAGERAGFRAAVKQHWLPLTPAPDLPDIEVVIEVTLTEDGYLEGDPRIIEPSPATSRRQQVAAFNATKAIIRAQPFDAASVEKFEAWRVLRFRFEATEPEPRLF